MTRFRAWVVRVKAGSQISLTNCNIIYRTETFNSVRYNSLFSIRHSLDCRQSGERRGGEGLARIYHRIRSFNVLSIVLRTLTFGTSRQSLG